MPSCSSFFIKQTEALTFTSHFSVMFPVHIVYLTFSHVYSCFFLSFLTLFFKFYLFIICPFILVVFIRNRLLRYGAPSHSRINDSANTKIFRKYKKEIQE